MVIESGVTLKFVGSGERSYRTCIFFAEHINFQLSSNWLILKINKAYEACEKQVCSDHEPVFKGKSEGHSRII